MGWVRIERVTWAERALWAGLVLVSIAPLALQPAPEAVARAYIAAVDGGDVEAALDLTATDFVLRPVLGGYYYRREVAGRVLEWRAALNERWQVVGWEYDPVGQEVRAEVEVMNDAWSLVGSRPRVNLFLSFRDNRLLTEQVRAEPKDLQRALQPFLEWASTAQPLELTRVWRHGQPVRTADSALRLVVLLREWRAARDKVAAGSVQGQD
ncbi:MAG: hypothetical protein ACREK2_10325 [Gemmatimonadota bacterium]